MTLAPRSTAHYSIVTLGTILLLLSKLITQDQQVHHFPSVAAFVISVSSPPISRNHERQKRKSERSSCQIISSIRRRRNSCLLQYGLYEVQEDMIIKRAQLEEELMKDAPAKTIAANKPKGSGSSGGFGGGGGAAAGGKAKKGNKKGGGTSVEALRSQAAGHAQVLRDQGVVRIDDVLSKDVADSIRSFVIQLRETSEKQVEANEIPSTYRFADVLLRNNRADVTMPLNGITYRGLHQALCKSNVGATLELLLGKDAVLYEFSCLISDPGSDRQVVHPDTPFYNTIDENNDEPVLYTCFMALQDVTLEMGPTLWLPHTHTREEHLRFFDESINVETGISPKDELLQSRPAFLGALPKGACGIYDSRLLHCGTANRGEKSRAIFYFSFKNPNVGYPGNPASIRPELSNRLTLGLLQEELESYMTGKGSSVLDSIAASMK